ncbi:MAG: hypothetical protein AAGF11_44150 [Myxococcota bacterium]
MKHLPPMQHPLWLLSLLAVAGCRTTTPVAPEPLPEPVIQPEPDPEPRVPITLVEQQVLTYVPAGLDPSGTIVLGSECEAWDDDGIFLGTIPEPQCSLWSDPEVRVSPDGRFVARLSDAAVTLEAEGAPVTLACDGCKPLAGLAWSPQGDRLALVREGKVDAVEIWSIEDQRKVKDLPLPLDSPVDDAQVGWSTSLYVLLTLADLRPSCDELSEDEYAVDEEGNEYEPGVDCTDYYGTATNDDDESITFSLARYPSLDAKPEIEPVDTGADEGSILGSMYNLVTQAWLDPSGNCLYYEETDSEPRESIGSRIATRSLAGACADVYGEDDDDDTYWSLDSVEWTSGPRPQLVAVTSRTDDDDYDYESGLQHSSYQIEVVELSEDRRQFWEEEVDAIDLPDPEESRWTEMVDRELLWAGAHEEVQLAWTHCFTKYEQIEGPDDIDVKETHWCEHTMKLPKKCELLERDPSHTLTLARCGANDELTLLGGQRLGQRIGLGVTDDARWSWGAGWLVTVDSKTGVVLRSLATPNKAQVLGPAEAWVETTLGSEQDRLVLHDEVGLQLWDAKAGRRLQTVPTRLPKATWAALSPSGERLAVTDGTQIEATVLGATQPAKTWAALDAGVLAWRQDERVVFSGPNIDRPTVAWDVETTDALNDGVPELGDAVVDPGWRWAMSTPHRAIRLIDGLAIWFDDSGVMLDDGRFEGEPAVLGDIMIRLGDDPLSSPIFAPEELHSLMGREGLARDFFAGRPIEDGPTTITVAQRDALAREAGSGRSAQAR